MKIAMLFTLMTVVSARRLSSHVTERPPIIAIGGLLTANDALIESRVSSSDHRIKTNIQSLDSKESYDKIRNLAVKSYDYSPSYLKHSKRLEAGNIGLLAHEVEKWIPDAVHTLPTKHLYDESHRKLSSFENFQMINKDVVFMTMLSALQEEMKKTDDLRKRVEFLEK